MSLSTRSNLFMEIVWNGGCGLHGFLYVSFQWLEEEIDQPRVLLRSTTTIRRNVAAVLRTAF